MAWADVKARIKFFGLPPNGLDGTPDEVNGFPSSSLGDAFSSATAKGDILAAVGWAKRSVPTITPRASVMAGGRVASAPLPILRRRHSRTRAFWTIITPLRSLKWSAVSVPSIGMPQRR